MSGVLIAVQSEDPAEEGFEEDGDEDGGDHVGGADFGGAHHIESDENDDERARRGHVAEGRACKQILREEGESGDAALIEEHYKRGEGAAEAERCREGEAGDGVNHGLGENDVGVSRGIGNRACDRHSADTEEKAAGDKALRHIAGFGILRGELFLDECAELLERTLDVEQLADDCTDGDGENHNEYLTQVVG